MINSKQLFKVLLEASERDDLKLERESVKSVLEDESENCFCIEVEGETESGISIFLFTEHFALFVDMSMDLGITEDRESGEWTKEYGAINVTSRYSEYENVKKVNLEFIQKWINDNVLSFVF